MATHAHKSVASLAAEMAQAVYEECAQNNAWYSANPNRRVWVRKNAPQFIKDARATLTEMLISDHVSEKEKEEIYDILLQDNSIPRNGSPVAN
jgi:mRNA degradation ribonuclease J1/J2